MVSYRAFSLPRMLLIIIDLGTSFRQHLGGQEVSDESEVLATR
jgi:hypothetical protein